MQDQGDDDSTFADGDSCAESTQREGDLTMLADVLLDILEELSQMRRLLLQLLGRGTQQITALHQ